jgi:hypothetical protein
VTANGIGTWIGNHCVLGAMRRRDLGEMRRGNNAKCYTLASVTCLQLALGMGNNTEAISQGRGGARTKVNPCLQCDRTDWSHAMSQGDSQRYWYLDR